MHARLPAELLLVFVSIFAAAILLFNIRRQGWTLPVLAVGIWAFVALVVGIIYPALLQALKVNPAQSSLEAPYIQRNITATRAAYDLKRRQRVKTFPASTTISPRQTVDKHRHYSATSASGIRTRRSRCRPSSASRASSPITRSPRSGSTATRWAAQADAGAHGRPGDLPVGTCLRSRGSTTHLQFTHGDGAAVALANQTKSNSNPVFARRGCRLHHRRACPKITQPDVYFGLGLTGYVVANTKQLEVDYQQRAEQCREPLHRKNATGGVQLSSIFTKAMFALRLGDFNLLISNQITDKSRHHVRP